MVSIKPNLDVNSWKPASSLGGKVNFFQAIGFKTSGTGYVAPNLQASLTPAVAAGKTAANQSSSQSGSSTSTSGGGNLGGTGAINGCTAAQTSANQKLGQQLAAPYGWSTGSEWTALNNLVMSESGWCNVAQNPGSSAYGIGQFLSQTWATVGGTKTDNSTTQIKLMLAYIKLRYKTPSAAWAFHKVHNFY